MLLAEDFQRPLDREILSHLNSLGDNSVVGWIDTSILKPFIDDVVTGQIESQGVEITKAQFPKWAQLYKIVDECAATLHVAKRPRVFVVNEPSFNAYTTNFVDPVIVIHSGLVYACETVDDLRFVIAHEMGHVACGHVKWMTVARALASALGMGKEGAASVISKASILPLLQWSREAEMSADRAALLCVQDMCKCEQTLAKLATGLPESITGKVDIDAFLSQGLDREKSEFSQTVLLLKRLTQSHPYPCTRIEQLREYSQSDTYQHVIMN
jgi:Zn-dependent protease with chaperone function